MTAQKPTGVFVRLPNDASDPQWAKAYAAVVGDEGTKKAALWDFIQIAKAIGTPVQGEELTCIGNIVWFENDCEPVLGSYVPAVFKKGAGVPVVSLLEAQAQIAARDAEIAMLREIPALFSEYEKLMDGGEDVAAMMVYADLQNRVRTSMKGGAA